MVSIGDSIPYKTVIVRRRTRDDCGSRILHALKQGKQTIYVRTVDTDVVVILAGIFHA